MRVGIVTPAFNVAPWIGDAVRSVLAQSHRDWTMTIVDDGSTDATAAIVAGFDDPRLRLIRQPNAGVSAARNRGLAETNTDAVLFLDGDDWLSPDALATLLTAPRADPRTVAVVGPYARVPDEGVPGGGVSGGGVSGHGRVRPPESGDLLERLLVRNLFANGGHLLIHRTALDAAGLFRSDLRYGEDWEFWIRLAQQGPFAAVRDPAPLLFVRERHGGAYLGMAANPASFVPCMEAIFNAPALVARLGPDAVARARRRAEAENDWIVGRELIRHGQRRDGRVFLRRSVRAAPSARRLMLLAAGSLPIARIGPFRPYPTTETV